MLPRLITGLFFLNVNHGAPPIERPAFDVLLATNEFSRRFCGYIESKVAQYSDSYLRHFTPQMRQDMQDIQRQLNLRINLINDEASLRAHTDFAIGLLFGFQEQYQISVRSNRGRQYHYVDMFAPVGVDPALYQDYVSTKHDFFLRLFGLPLALGGQPRHYLYDEISYQLSKFVGYGTTSDTWNVFQNKVDAVCASFIRTHALEHRAQRLVEELAEPPNDMFGLGQILPRM